MTDLTNLYRSLLRLYPASFRDEYEEPMDRQFRDEQRDARGWEGHLKLWLRAFADIAVSAPRELGRELGQDLHFALRVYAKRPAGAIVAVGTLALAIGASTGVFSVASALLLRGLPFADAGRLVELRLSPFGAGMSRAGFMEWRDKSAYLENAATFSTSGMNLNSGRNALRVRVTETSANLFTLLGVRSSLGRTFVPGEDRTGENHLAVISHRIWQQSYGGDPSVIGSAAHLNGSSLTIIGVAPPGFDYPGDVDVWIPTVFDIETIPKQGAVVWETIGRLRPGVSLARAREEFGADVSHAGVAGRDLPFHPELVGLRDQLTREIRQSVLILLSVVILVLLTACANVAQLLLSRTAERHQELALRSALGASRSRLIQQLTVEAMGLTLSGSVLGMIVALLVSRMANGILPAQLATQRYTILDWRVLCFAVTLALIAGAFFGIMPAWLIGRMQPSTQLVRAQPGAGEPVTNRLRSILVGLQVAFALTLLISSFTLSAAFLRLIHTDLGFDTANVVTLNVSTQGTKYESGMAKRQFYSSLEERLRSIPGVEAVGAVNYLPLQKNVVMAGTMTLTDSGRKVDRVMLNGATPGYFRAIGTRFIAGGEFAGQTGKSADPPVIVNEAFARQAGFGTNIVGHRITAFWSTGPYVVSGVVVTARMGGPEYEGETQAYWPVEEEPPAALTFVMSVHGNPEDYLARCRDAVIEFDRSVPIYEVKTLGQRLRETLGRPRFYTVSILFLGSLALLIALAGVYSTSSRAICQRQHELGVRMALGASTRGVRVLILRQGLIPVLLGILAGCTGAVGCGLILRHLFSGARAPDLPAFAWSSGCLLAVALGTAWSVTARILAIDPIESIRAE